MVGHQLEWGQEHDQSRQLHLAGGAEDRLQNRGDQGGVLRNRRVCSAEIDPAEPA